MNVLNLSIGGPDYLDRPFVEKVGSWVGGIGEGWGGPSATTGRCTAQLTQQPLDADENAIPRSLLLPYPAALSCCPILLPYPAALSCCPILLPYPAALSCCPILLPYPAALSFCPILLHSSLTSPQVWEVTGNGILMVSAIGNDGPLYGTLNNPADQNDVWEVTGNGILMVSAIGNDGPLYGTLNNPADQNDVIGVGGIDYTLHIASFSSRGMTTWELPHGYGRMKPDIVAYGREVVGSKINGGCKSLSGTSVASPVVAGAVCLLASVVPEAVRWGPGGVLNPASMKQALVEGADRLNGPHMFEQGSGQLNLLRSHAILASYTPRASVHPATLDLTDCPYAWPWCRQPLFASALPLIINATVLNGMGVTGWLAAPPVWVPTEVNLTSTAAAAEGNLSSAAEAEAEAAGANGFFVNASASNSSSSAAPPPHRVLHVRFSYPAVLWPWSGNLGIYLRVHPAARHLNGTIAGAIHFTVVSPPGPNESAPRTTNCSLPLRVAIMPTPPRHHRVLWDQFHNVRYPPGYIPRDSLDVRNDILDWHGDHPHTNFHGLFAALREWGFTLEVLGSPLTCFDAREYGALLMVDMEEEYYAEEIAKLHHDVTALGLGLIVVGDWYHVPTMKHMRFFDDNTRSWWTPAT
ncbi:unnamed protein product, partial [Closterium sp. NIES-54]